jgi:4-hydroxybenzoate polyprenyltransferase
LYIYSIKKINLRQISGTKAIWISIVWTLIGIVIPKLTLYSFSWSDLHYFILFLALTIPGDLRDSDFDNTEMKTIPQVFGDQNANLLFYFLMTSFLVFNFLFNQIDIIGIGLVLIFLPIFFSKNIPFRHELMDGVLLILGISYLIG